jgi:hypothetical protein
MNLFCYEAKQPNLKLKTRPKQLIGSLLLAFVLSVIRLHVVVLSAANLNILMLSVIMLRVISMSIVMLNIIALRLRLVQKLVTYFC